MWVCMGIHFCYCFKTIDTILYEKSSMETQFWTVKMCYVFWPNKMETMFFDRTRWKQFTKLVHLILFSGKWRWWGGHNNSACMGNQDGMSAGRIYLVPVAGGNIPSIIVTSAHACICSSKVTGLAHVRTSACMISLVKPLSTFPEWETAWNGWTN
jgi:hypothetical protein